MSITADTDNMLAYVLVQESGNSLLRRQDPRRFFTEIVHDDRNQLFIERLRVTYGLLGTYHGLRYAMRQMKPVDIYRFILPDEQTGKGQATGVDWLKDTQMVQKRQFIVFAYY